MILPTLVAAIAMLQPQTKSVGRVFAFVIGIDRYADSSIGDLTGAANDAEKFTTWLVDQAKIPPSRIIKLTSATELKPTRESLLGACGIVQRWQLRPSDTLLLFYAGHAVDVNGGAYLIPYDGKKSASILIGATLDQIAVPTGQKTESPDPTATATPGGISATDPQQLNWLSCDAILRALGQNAGTVIAFFDMCRGAAWDRGAISVNTTLTTAIMQASDPRSLPADIAPTRVGILHACSRNQSSEEFQGRGRMSTALEQALTTNVADVDRDGQVTYGEIQDYVRVRVASESGQKQVPANRDEGDVRGFVMANFAKGKATEKPAATKAPATAPKTGSKGKKTTANQPATPPKQPEVRTVIDRQPGTSPFAVATPEEIAAPAPDQKSFYTEGTYSVLPGPHWIDLTSGEGAFTARIPAQDVTDPRKVRRIENKLTTPDGAVTAKTYAYELQDGYYYRRYAATVLDYPGTMPEGSEKGKAFEKKVLAYGKQLVQDQGKTSGLEIFGNSDTAKFLATNLSSLVKNIDVNKISNIGNSLRPENLLGRVPIIGGLAGSLLGGRSKDKGTPIYQDGCTLNIGQHPGFRIQWRKVNEGFGILQIGVIQNRLYILSEVYAGGDGRLPIGVVPRLFIDSFMPTGPMLANPSDVIGYVGG